MKNILATAVILLVALPGVGRAQGVAARITAAVPTSVEAGGRFSIDVRVPTGTTDAVIIQVFRREGTVSTLKHASTPIRDGDADDHSPTAGLIRYEIVTDQTWLPLSSLKVASSSQDYSIVLTRPQSDESLPPMARVRVVSPSGMINFADVVEGELNSVLIAGRFVRGGTAGAAWNATSLKSVQNAFKADPHKIVIFKGTAVDDSAVALSNGDDEATSWTTDPSTVLRRQKDLLFGRISLLEKSLPGVADATTRYRLQEKLNDTRALVTADK